MKRYYPKLSIKTLCELFGKTRHAYYDRLWYKQDQLLKDELILQHVAQIRINQPRIGTRKLHYMLNEQLLSHSITIGRDYLFNLLAKRKILIRTRKRKVITTDSKHWMKLYPNLIEDLRIDRTQQVWVSDITYIRIRSGFAYLCLVSDAYSRKIIGYSLQRDLSKKGCLTALSMAVAQKKSSTKPLIHHSDRGSQYCCKEYVQILKNNKVLISMTASGNPYQNAIAERINGIIKNEFCLDKELRSFQDMEVLLHKSITVYNTLRPHLSCNYMTPDQAQQTEGELQKKWKHYPKTRPIHDSGLSTN